MTLIIFCWYRCWNLVFTIVVVQEMIIVNADHSSPILGERGVRDNSQCPQGRTRSSQGWEQKTRKWVTRDDSKENQTVSTSRAMAGMEKMTGVACAVKKRELFFYGISWNHSNYNTSVLPAVHWNLVSDFVWNNLNHLHLSQILGV